MTPPASHAAPDWQGLDHRHVWHPYTQMHNAPPPVPVVRAEGVHLCTASGQRLVDGISSWWVNIHGHNVPRLNAALAEQASRMAHVMFAGFTHEPGSRLAAALAERVGLPRVFYSDNGSTAVEVAMKMAYQHWRHRGQAQRSLFVAFEHAYHGDTFGAMAAGGTALFHGEFAPLLFNVRRAHGPRCPDQPQGGPCAPHCPRSLANILAQDGTQVAAVILEPKVQGAGGMRIWPDAALRQVGALCRAHDLPLIADEVFTGFARTGRMWAFEHGDLQPDLVCLSKALTAGYLPLGVTLASQRIYDAFLSEDRHRTFFHGHSFTGNPLACAVALESLALFDDTQCLQRTQQLQALYAPRLAELQRHPAVAETRGCGALAVVELKTEGGYLAAAGPAMAEAFLQRGVLLRPLGNVIYFLPPYCIDDGTVHGVFDRIHEVISRFTS